MKEILSSTPHIDPIPGIAVGLVAGIILGLVHFGSLWWNTRLFTEGSGMFAVLSIQTARFALLVAVFFILALCGMAALLAGLGGLLTSRQIVLHRFKAKS